MRLSTQNGIRQQPNPPPTKKIPPQINHDIKPVLFSTRVIIGCWQCGQIHCIGISPYSIDCVVISIWVPTGGPCGGKPIADVGYIPTGGPCGDKPIADVGYIPTGGACGCKIVPDVEYIPGKGGIGGACG